MGSWVLYGAFGFWGKRKLLLNVSKENSSCLGHPSPELPPRMGHHSPHPLHSPFHSIPVTLPFRPLETLGLRVLRVPFDPRCRIAKGSPAHGLAQHRAAAQRGTPGLSIAQDLLNTVVAGFSDRNSWGQVWRDGAMSG